MACILCGRPAAAPAAAPPLAAALPAADAAPDAAAAADAAADAVAAAAAAAAAAPAPPRAPPPACPRHPLCPPCRRAAAAAYERLAAPYVCPAAGCRPAEHSLLGRLEPTELPPEVQCLFARYTIKRAYRVVNLPQTLLFEQCRERFEKEAEGGGKVVRVFHGTSRAATGSIVKNGFNVSFSGKANGQVHGPGVYTATAPDISLGYTRPDCEKVRCMFVCDALPGPANAHVRSGSILVLKREQQVNPRWLVYFA